VEALRSFVNVVVVGVFVVFVDFNHALLLSCRRYLRPDASFVAGVADLLPALSGQGSTAAAAASPVPANAESGSESPQKLLAWRYVCRIARSVSLSRSEAAEVCTDALHRAVFGVLGPTAMAIHAAEHIEEDAALRGSYGSLWGITSTQV
jgi:hypothetical protein